MPLQVDVVSAERRLFRGEVDELYARSVEGEIGILPGHEPIVLSLEASPLRLKETDGSRTVIAIHRTAYLECRGDQVNVLADIAELVEDIDVPRARAALERAIEHLRDPNYPGDAKAEHTRAQLRLRLASGGDDTE